MNDEDRQKQVSERFRELTRLEAELKNPDTPKERVDEIQRRILALRETPRKPFDFDVVSRSLVFDAVLVKGGTVEEQYRANIEMEKRLLAEAEASQRAHRGLATTIRRTISEMFSHIKDPDKRRRVEIIAANPDLTASEYCALFDSNRIAFTKGMRKLMKEYDVHWNGWVEAYRYIPGLIDKQIRRDKDLLESTTKP